MKLKDLLLLCWALLTYTSYGQYFKRAVVPKKAAMEIEEYRRSDRIVVKLHERLNIADPSYSLFSDMKLMNLLQQSAGNIPYSLNQYVHNDIGYLRELKAKGERFSGRKLPDLTLYYELQLQSGTDLQRLQVLNKILAIDEVETAYFRTKIDKIVPGYNTGVHREIGESVVLLNTPDYNALQEYEDPAPLGIDARFAWTMPGGDGSGVKLADVEIANYLKHEDLAEQNIQDVHTKVPDDSHIHHALAAMGEILSADNGFGMKGIAYKAEGYFSSICLDSLCADDNTVQGLTAAIAHLGKGDVLLTEIQTVAPLPFGMPIEYDQAEFDVIITAVANGIIVMEPAGNGNKNMDDHVKYENRFDTTFRYSGAFIVGSCYPKKVSAGRQARSKYYSSSYGKRVDFFSWGEKIPSLGYGTLSGSSYKDYYSDDFCCTSGATPIVTGAVILMQSIHKKSAGDIINADLLRHMLKSTGTPSYDPPSDMIGVQPNLKNAINMMMAYLAISNMSKHELIIASSFIADQIEIKSTVPALLNVELYSLAGVKVLSGNFDFGKNAAVRIPVSQLNAGVYIMKVYNESFSSNAKIIKQ